jgi:hypothetical protein
LRFDEVVLPKNWQGQQVRVAHIMPSFGVTNVLKNTILCKPFFGKQNIV